MPQLDNVLCVIPARAGSKGVSRKNERIVGGKPLVSHSIEHALFAGIPAGNVVLSTNGDSIMSIGERYGIRVRRRPVDISGDESSTEDALLDAMNHSPESDHVILLQPTSPIRLANTLSDCIMAYLKGAFDSLLTVTKFHNFFWQEKITTQTVGGSSSFKWAWKPNYTPHSRQMRQSMGRDSYMYFENGNIYITDAKVLRETHCRIGKNPCVYPITELEGMQIDTLAEMQVINAILSGKIINHGKVQSNC